ncbi:MAG: UvrB/UvrC motif-containing protein [Verrucomicrobiota bacterium]|nr:UvrB/UvrC motif-containing protein [Verrucomicrobiota bacterium]
MNFDISHLLDSWDYHAGQIVVRKFQAKDGREKIQLRVDLGILQMNVTGRPDGKQPFGHESLLEHFESRLQKHRDAHDGSDQGFKLNAEDCSKLQQEAIQYHHRYICLYQIKDFAGVLRDTQRNQRVFAFVEQYAEAPELAWAVQQIGPQLLMMQVRAKGSLLVESSDFEAAIEAVEQGLEEIRAFFKEHARPEMADQSGELHSLETWIQELRSAKPLSEREKLENELRDAVKREDYEKAAEVRDALKNLH